LKTQKKKKYFTRETFIKTLVFFTVLLIVVWFSFTKLTVFNPADNHLTRNEQKVDSKLLTKNIYQHILTRNINIIKKFGENAGYKAITEDELSKFINNYTNIVSMTVWPVKTGWTVRYVKPDFWKRNDISELPGNIKQKLFDFLFAKKFPDAGKDHWYCDGYWNNGSSTLISIGYIFDNSRIKAAEIKVDPVFPDMILKMFGSGTSVYIVDSSEKFIFSTGSESLKKIKSGNLFKKLYFPELGWRIYYKQKTGNISFNDKFPGLLKKLIILFSLLILTTLLSMTIDRPLIDLTEKITDVGRGDFTKVIPVYNNRYLDKIASIFNYMSMEMERVKKINLGNIIDEKNKTDAIIDHIADGVIVTDVNDRILKVNNLAESWFNISEQECKGKLVYNVISDKNFKGLLKRIKDGAPHGSCEFSFTRDDNTEARIFNAHASKITNKDDVIINIVIVFRDITRIKDAEKVKKELVSMVAHELKSPLSAIYGFSELLKDLKLKDRQADEYAKIISNEATRLTDLINKFLDISRLESGKTTLHPAFFNIKAVIVKTIDTFKTMIDKKRIKLVVNVDKNIPDAWGDQDMIERVLINLLSNAIKYSPDKAKIGIEAKTAENFVVVSVIDNGYGIPKESLNKIFNKFYRVSESESENEPQGTGLGLSLCKEIVEKHGGEIKVQSKLGVGSVFTFTIPLKNKQDV